MKTEEIERHKTQIERHIEALVASFEMASETKVQDLCISREVLMATPDGDTALVTTIRVGVVL